MTKGVFGSARIQDRTPIWSTVAEDASMTDLTHRVLGTSVTLPREKRNPARTDLDFDLGFEARGGAKALQKGMRCPDDYDIFGEWFHGIDLFWASGSVHPIRSDQLALRERPELAKPGALADGVDLGVGSRANGYSIRSGRRNAWLQPDFAFERDSQSA